MLRCIPQALVYKSRDLDLGCEVLPAISRMWDDATTPRTEKPVRFIPFVGSPSYTTRAECRAKSLRFPA